jgi:hypothetical protein
MFIFIFTPINNIKENRKQLYHIVSYKMSAAMARKRRAESSSVNQSSIPSNTITNNNRPGTASTGAGSSQGTGLTLPQVISVIDTRLIVLETFMKETKSTDIETKSASNTSQVQLQEKGQVQVQGPGIEINEIVEEMDTRFDILAREIADLKDVVLKLQAYTMEVNKTLLEERIHILSDLNTTVEDKQTNTLTFENI